MELIEKVTEAISSDVEALGYSIYKIEFVKEDGQKYLRVMIDNDSVITIDDCVKTVRAINPILDEVDLIKESYILDVCSKGGENE